MTPPAAYGSSEGSDRPPNSGSPGEMDPFIAGDSGPGLAGPQMRPDPWLGQDPEAGRVCGCRPGVPFMLPYVYPVSVFRRPGGGALHAAVPLRPVSPAG